MFPTRPLLAKMGSRGTMMDVQHLETLRPLGKLEQVSAACHHLGFFNNVGVSAHYRVSYVPLPESAASNVRHLVLAAAQSVVKQHRILSAVPVNEDSSAAYFAALPAVDLAKSITFLERKTARTDSLKDKELDELLEKQHNTSFQADYGNRPFWRLVILHDRTKTAEFTASFIYHHAVGDGVSGLVFHQAFYDALEAVSSAGLPADCSGTEPAVVPDKDSVLVPPLEQLHPLPIDTAGNPVPVSSLQSWTGAPIQMPCTSRWTSLHLAASVSQAFFQDCRAHKTSVTCALSSIVAKTLFGILPPATAGSLTCIVPVSLRPWLRLPRTAADRAMGSLFDATKVHFVRPSGQSGTGSEADSIWPGADKAAGAISRYLSNVSPSGEPYTAVAVLQNVPDFCPVFTSLIGTPRDAAFEVTNIGQFPAKTDAAGSIWKVGEVLLSRSAVASGAAVTVSVATGGDGSMTVGFSWQEGVVEDNDAEKVCHGVKSYFDWYRQQLKK